MSQISLENIVDVQKIGAPDNPKNMNDLLSLTSKTSFKSSKDDEEKVLLLVIDLQNDFMENGSLAVPNSHVDVKNLIEWTYQNFEKITDITVSQDAHKPYQIFHPAWWINKDGENPSPFTVITKEDVNNHVWTPLFHPQESIDYLNGLEHAGKKKLVIWPYHCLEGSFGQSIEVQFTNLVYFHSVARESDPTFIVKGQNPLSEMYGIFKPEYDPSSFINIEYLNKLLLYDKIVIAGEAKSHCVLESIKQIMEFFQDNIEKKLPKVFILEDCMSIIPGFKEETDISFKEFSKNPSFQIVQSSSFKL